MKRFIPLFDAACLWKSAGAGFRLSAKFRRERNDAD
jgi:hypothetical protein